MKIYTYSEQNLIKTFVSITLYLAVWIVGASICLGGFDRLLDKINNFGSAKMLGLLVGILILVPYLLLMKLIFTKIVINIDDEKLRIQMKGQPDKIILFSNIYSMKINAEKINTLHLYDQNNKELWAILPTANDKNFIEEIPKIIADKVPFKKETLVRKFLNTSYNSYNYTKQ